MIPLKLYIRNFMCYREQVLDLSGVHLACLTGNNGTGKSALLDALTWVLWGRSRVGARRDDELIHIGQNEMEVEFEFLLANASNVASDAGNASLAGDGIRYRVLRKRSSRHRGQSSLELQGWDAAEERFRPLSEPTISRTQHKIVDLLRMDYDTFINSAFLLQGRADEFTVKRAAERKRVLGDILGLEMYDRYERLAKEAAQRVKEQADQILATIDQIDRELAREGEYQAAVRAAEAELEQVQQERAQAQAAHDQVVAALREAQAAQQQLGGLERRLAAGRQEVTRLSGEIERHSNHLRELEQALAQEAAIEEGYAAFQQAIAQNETFNTKLSALVALNEQRSALEQRITAVRHELDVQRHSAGERVRQLREDAGALDQEREWEQLRADLARLDEREEERERARAEMLELNAQIAALLAENKRAEADAAQSKEKIVMLASAASGADTEEQTAHCPLCGQALEADECARLLKTLEAGLEAERAAYADRVEQIREGQQQVKDLQAAVTEIGRELRQRTGWQRKEAALAHFVHEARVAYADLPAAEQSLQAFEQRLADGAYAREERESLAQVEGQLGELGYDADAHRQVQGEMEAARPYEARMNTLREARSGVETIRLAISQLEESRAEVDRQQEADREQADALRREADRLPDLQRQSLEARQILETSHDREQQANLRLGAARNKLDHCDDLRQQRVTRREEEQALREKQGIYQELQRAFGKNGVQALLIEIAIPEIEEEANRLLQRMTQGKMQVRFETQRDTKRGDTVETMDIHISDGRGTRAYETYSGGERYRINFAIRIALSRLLARRAGAQLRMLVIDEGFGTQDSDGRKGLIDALNAVQDDFSCILVITHIEELKDAFNVRIEVTKTEEGSEIITV
jgi:exonuclease SbcC